MKKPVLLLLLVLNAVSALCRDEEVFDKPPFKYIGHELVPGHGLLPSAQLFAGVSNHRYRNERASGAFFATYRYHITDVLSIGASFAFEHESGTWDYRDSYHSGSTSSVSGSFNRSCYTIAPEVTFNYFDGENGKVRLYSVVGLGYTQRVQGFTFDNNVGSGYYPASYIPHPRPERINLYICPLGVRFGGALGGFVEIGIGYKGMLNYGMTYRF